MRIALNLSFTVIRKYRKYRNKQAFSFSSEHMPVYFLPDE